MLRQFNPYGRSLKKNLILKKVENLDITGSLQNIQPPSEKKYNTSTKYKTYEKSIVNKKTIEITDLTGSLENIEKPSETKYITGTKNNYSLSQILNGSNVRNDFKDEIFEYSARYVKKHIDWWNEEENSITLANTLMDYGTEGPTAENFEVIVHGIHSPQIYTVKQDGINIVVTFNERLFSYDGLQRENVIIIGKLFDIALLTEKLTENSVVITDENGQALIL